MRQVISVAFAALFAGAFWSASTDAADRGRQVSIRFPAFSLSPGERISGVKVSVSQGRLSAGCRPNRWTCDYSGTTVHCHSPHSAYATAISGMLPEIFVSDNPGGLLSIEASVEFIDGDGKEYSKEFRESDLIIR